MHLFGLWEEPGPTCYEVTVKLLFQCRVTVKCAEEAWCDRQLQSSLTTDFINRFASLHLHPDANKWDPAPITQRQVQGTIAELALRDLVMVLAGLGLSLCSLFLSVSLLSWVHLSVSGRFVGRCFLIGCLQVKLLPLELSFPHLFPVITSSS